MKQKITLLLAGVVTVACLYWVFKPVNMTALWNSILAVNPLWAMLSIAIFYFSMYLRALRWGWLFKPNYEIPGNHLFRPLMICFAFNSILPGRVGEFVRAFYVGKKEGTGFPAAMATVVSERIFDGVTLLSFLAFALYRLPPIPPGLRVEVGNYSVNGAQIQPLINKIVIMCVVLVAGVIALMIPAIERLLVKILQKLPLVPKEISAKLVEILQGVVKGFESVRSPKNLAVIVVYSFVIWILVAIANMVLAWGMAGVSSMNLLQSMAVMTLIGVFIMIPAAPGYWGLYEAGTIFALKVLDVQGAANPATAYALVLHLSQFVPIVGIGLIYAAQSQVKITKIDKGDPADDHERMAKPNEEE